MVKCTDCSSEVTILNQDPPTGHGSIIDSIFIQAMFFLSYVQFCAQMHIKKIIESRLNLVNCCMEDEVQGHSLLYTLLFLKHCSPSKVLKHRLPDQGQCASVEITPNNCMTGFL